MQHTGLDLESSFEFLKHFQNEATKIEIGPQNDAIQLLETTNVDNMEVDDDPKLSEAQESIHEIEQE